VRCWPVSTGRGERGVRLAGDTLALTRTIGSVAFLDERVEEVLQEAMEAPGRGCPLARCRQPGQVGEGRFQAKGLGIAQAQYPLGAAQDALGMRSLAGIISTGVRGSQKGGSNSPWTTS
jgi:hypothetical protein